MLRKSSRMGFAGVGADITSNTQGEILGEDDMSWLNDL